MRPHHEPAKRHRVEELRIEPHPLPFSLVDPHPKPEFEQNVRLLAKGAVARPRLGINHIGFSSVHRFDPRKPELKGVGDL